MGKDKWVETKKEYDIGEHGQYIPKKVTTELDSYRRKEKLDLFLRAITLFSIFIPILIFFSQQASETSRQKRSIELDTYTDATYHISLLLERKRKDPTWENLTSELNYKIVPKINFLNNGTILNLTDSIQSCLNMYFANRDVIHLLDTTGELMKKAYKESCIWDSINHDSARSTYRPLLKQYQNEMEYWFRISDDYTGNADTLKLPIGFKTLYRQEVEILSGPMQREIDSFTYYVSTWWLLDEKSYIDIPKLDSLKILNVQMKNFILQLNSTLISEFSKELKLKKT